MSSQPLRRRRTILAPGDEQVAAEKGRDLLDAVHRFARAR